MAAFSTAADVFDKARPWQWRVIRASFGTTTGLIIMAMLAKVPKVGMAFGQTCDIRIDGYVETLFRDRGKWYPPTIIGRVEDVRDNVRRLCDHLKLDDAEREAVFMELRKWIRRDHRATSGVLDK